LLAVDWELRVSIVPSGRFGRGVVVVVSRPFQWFVGVEARGAVMLLGATGAALVWANSPWIASYDALWSTRLSVQVGEAELSKDLRRWVNDGLMALFFLVLGLEFSRQLKLGELRRWHTVATASAAAFGGVVVPAVFYLALNPGGSAGHGWVIVLAADLALVLGVLALVGARCPPQLRVFLLTVVLIGDIAAITLAGLLYGEEFSLLASVVVVGLLAVVTLLRLLRVLRTLAYLVVGVVLWVATSASGIHPAVIALLLGVVLTAYPPAPAEVLDVVRLDADEALPPIQRLQQRLHLWSSYLVVPVFALANAGVVLDHELLARAVGSSITLGVLAGLVVGKLVGVFGASLLAVRAGVGTLPRLATHRQLTAAAALAGTGLTMALFVTDLVFNDQAAMDEAKVGILVASAAAATLGGLLFLLSGRWPHADGSAGGGVAAEG
jgi:Na+/H+ antiporter NhaA